MLRLAALIKRTTDDGLIEIQDNVELGKTYVVDDDTIRMATGYNHMLGKTWTRSIIDVHDGEDVKWFPTELLRMEWKEVGKDGNYIAENYSEEDEEVREIV